MQIIPVILSGGMGARLWPLSRQARPKQFLELAGEESLIVATTRRVTNPARFSRPVFVCNDDHRFMVAEQLRDAGLVPCDILLEPEARNTAAAIAAAAAHVEAAHGGDAIMLVLPSDHLIRDNSEFLAAVDIAAQAAVAGRIVTFGIHADGPETGYGYIESGNPAAGIVGANDIVRFTEKPDKKTATGFVESGRHFWNGGIFALSAKTAAGAFDVARPGMFAVARRAVAESKRDLDFIRLDAGAYAEFPVESFDRLVMEKSTLGAVVPVDMGWSDIGSWDAIWRVLPHDDDGNACVGDVVLSGSRNCLVHSEHGLVTMVGVEGLVVVATDDSVLVMDRDLSQDLRGIVDALQADRRPEVETANTVHRPWGSYQDIDRGAGFRAKRITVRPGGRLSLQRHERRAEHWVVVDGVAHVTKGDREIVLEANQSIYIPAGENHRLENRADTDIHLIEVQTGDYLEEDDIERLEDSYGRID
ncbi:mannose-1-phosphate guanylyltransferase/mannose-6-phosphate isomerase [Thalassospiraceae bacterium LMO-JJ14]|nr:mannose-1-phosphate guanylyltransferase/mannose-6-phosphate isomerase [Thalassospiraceae bacterium LMO-JJ14]